MSGLVSWRRMALALAVSVLMVAVAAAWGVSRSAAAPAPQRATSLIAYDSCAQFLGNVRARARGLLAASGLRGYPGLVRYGDLPFTAMPVMADGASPPPPSATAPVDVGAPVAESSPQQGVDFSGTNVQEAGVDEPDLVKTDGRRLFAVHNGRVHAYVVEGGTPRWVDSIGLEDITPSELLLVGNRLLVIGTGLAADPAAAGDTMPYMLPAATALVEVDVTAASDMKRGDVLRVDGAYLTGRLTGTTARIVIRSSPDLPLVYPLGDPETAELRARRANTRIIRRSTPETWVPSYSLDRAGSVADPEGRVVRCRDVSHTQRFSGLGMITVLTVDLSDGIRIADSDAVMTDGDLVYASPTALYVATPRWFDQSSSITDEQTDDSTTLIHRFDTSQPLGTTYRGSGQVPGFLLNQFSLSEHEGRLRAATTDEPNWFAGDTQEESESLVTVLEERDGALAQVGQVGGLGRGERIYAVRFIGTRGYVVTFRQTDPLYTLDLSDPANPRVLGELKIPGFSSYLHPVGEDLLLGIGQAADDEGRVRGTQVSLFDVSDPANPRRIQQREVRGANSEAESDHRAFLYWAPTRLLVLPTWIYDNTGGLPFIGAIGFTVTPEAITEVDRITHPPDRSTGGYPPVLRRSIVVGSSVLTVSDRGVMSSTLDTLQPVVFAPYE